VIVAPVRESGDGACLRSLAWVFLPPRRSMLVVLFLATNRLVFCNPIREAVSFDENMVL
jgi:hypothetical protein